MCDVQGYCSFLEIIVAVGDFYREGSEVKMKDHTQTNNVPKKYFLVIKWLVQSALQDYLQPQSFCGDP